ncbi:DUF3466 family protein [Aliidiomarina halalkaliphila]|uniref:DUF3466 family protein n=1 Tax=Aliidiomarina halalkaliphila TaxID=2593535 RepID=A0A552X3X6_9GAMM|nr:DUF3466 family protein [Aliidiomarina halalkaliphila]TRW49737.1 DUF3466 family protein [Aliidiomarina halalkaliphila]
MRNNKLAIAISTALVWGIGTASADSIPEGYTVTELALLPQALNMVPHGMNEQGRVVGTLTDILNQNIRLDLLDPEDFPNVEDVMNPTDVERRRIRDRLIAGETVSTSPRNQKLAMELGFLFDVEERELAGFDENDAETGQRSDSADFRALSINNQGIIVGQAGLPYHRIEGTDTDGEEATFFTRESFPVGAWTDGVNYRTVTGNEGLIQGGTASLYAINDSHLAVGYASVADGWRLEEIYDRCTTPEDEEGEPISLEPLSVCLWRFWFANSGIREGVRTPFTDEEAYAWQFDAQGNVIEQGPLGFAFDPEADLEDGFATVRYAAIARDVNNHGDIVGTSRRVLQGAQFRRATWFNGPDGPVSLRSGTGDGNISEAVAVNDQRIVVGYTDRFFDQEPRSRLFYIDLDDPDLTAEYPVGFYAAGAWRPRAINNNNVVVGRAEVEINAQSNRRYSGFVFDINSGSLRNLNDYLPCDATLRIIDAVDINDSGEILAMAMTTKQVEEDGDLRDYNALISVVLKPSSQEPEVCTGPGSEIDRNTRKGAYMNPISVGVLSLLALITLRRRKQS